MLAPDARELGPDGGLRHADHATSRPRCAAPCDRRTARALHRQPGSRRAAAL